MNQQYFDDFEEVFRTQGWKRIVRDAEEAIRDREVNALHARSFEEVAFYRGEATQLAALVSLENTIATLRASLVDEGE